MKKIFLTLFTIWCFTLISQNFDSLIYVSIKLNSDTDKVNLFYAQGFSGRLKSPQYAYDCAKQAEFFANQSKSTKHIAKANNLLGILYYRKGDLKKALQYHQKALEIRESINDEHGIAMSEANLGNIYIDLKKTELAENSYLRSLQLSSKIGNEKQAANCYINLGVLKVGQKQLEDAEKYFYNAFKIAKTTMDYELEALCLNNLSVINIEKKEYEPAIGNSMDALKVKEIMGNEIEKTDSYINLAKAHFYLNDVTNYTYYLNKADSLCNVFEYTEAKITLLELKTTIYESTKQFEQALSSYKRYHQLKDSLVLEYKAISDSNNFTEEPSISENRHAIFRFPVLLLATLISISILLIYLIYKNKR